VRTLVLTLSISLSLAAVPVQQVDAFGPHEAAARFGETPPKIGIMLGSADTHRNAPKTDTSNPVSAVALDANKRGRTVTRQFDAPGDGRPQTEGLHPQTNALGEEYKALKSQLAALKESKNSADKAVEELGAELQRLNTELIAIRQASANALQIQAERDKLQESVINLERDLEAIQREKQALENDHRQNWFLIGAGVLSGGLLLGLALPRLSWRKRSSWDSF